MKIRRPEFHLIQNMTSESLSFVKNRASSTLSEKTRIKYFTRTTFISTHCWLHSDLCPSLSYQPPALWKPFPLPPFNKNSTLLTQMMTSYCRNLSTSQWIHASVTKGCLPTSVTGRLWQHIQSGKHCSNQWTEFCYHYGGCRKTGPELPRSLLTLYTWGPSLLAPKSSAGKFQWGGLVP